MADAKITDVQTDGNEITFKGTFNIKELVKEDGTRSFVTYDMSTEVKKVVVKMLVDSILEDSGREITDNVLKDVNWPEIIRSEIAQRVIKEVANKSSYDL